jgi:hypothetical protein
MEKEKLIQATTPEGKAVNAIANYLNAFGTFNIRKIVDMYNEEVLNNPTTHLDGVQNEIIKQMKENMKTCAIWEKWGE